MTALASHDPSQFGTLLAALIAVFVAATVSSTVGFAFSAFAAGVLLRIVKDHVAVVVIMLISSIALQTYCVALLWRQIEITRIAWFLLGGMLALPVGIHLLLVLSTPGYSVFVGGLLAIYGFVTLSKQTPTLQCRSRFADATVGAIGGITGPLVAFPGAAVVIWCNAMGLDKGRQRCVYQPYILIMQIATLAALAMLGETKSIEMAHGLFVVPAILGAHIGFRIFARITDAQFKALMSVLLIVSGLGILGNGLQ